MASVGRTAERLQNRPAHAVLVDCLPPMDGEVVSVIQEALSQALTLVYHLKGVCRISYFSLTALGTFPEALFPIQLVRGNLNQLISAITELQSFTGLAARRALGPHHTGGHLGGALVEGMQQVVEQFHRMAQNFRQGSDTSFPSQLEVTVLTCQSPSLIQAALEGVGERVNVDHLTRIQVVCINRKQVALDHVQTEEVDDFPLDMSTSDLCSSVLDVCSVECEAVALSAIFKGWLHASTTDQEDVHIELPPTTGSGEQTVLKCDLSECMLDPALLPMFEAHFSIHPPSTTPFTGSTANNSKPTTSQQKATQALPSDSVRHFMASSLVDREGVCESVLFGLPMFLKPTSCWKLDWEELESNTHNFAAVCKLLKERDQMLIVSEHGSTPVPRPTKNAPSQQFPSGHFLVLPSPSTSSLLIKPIIVSELYLPSVPSASTEEPSCDTMVNVEGSLEKLPTQPLYNPLEVCSGLFSGLNMLQTAKKGGGGRTANSSAGTKRRPPVPTQQSEAQRTTAISRSLGPKKSRLTVTSSVSGSHGNTSNASRGSGRVNPLRYQPPPYLGDDFEM